MQPTLDQIINWAKEAGSIAKEGFKKQHTIQFKSATDVVTEVDHNIEKGLINHILSEFPEHSILGEENGEVNGHSENCWYIDPLDGTINYSHRLPIYSISIAYQENGVMKLGVVYDPSLDECFSAERGKGAWLNGEAIHVSDCSSLQQALLVTGFPHDNPDLTGKNLKIFNTLTNISQGVRRLGSAALDVCWVGCGRMDGYWDLKIHAWDIAAATLIVEEAGGKVTDHQGNPDYFKPPYAFIAATHGIHGELLRHIRG